MTTKMLIERTASDGVMMQFETVTAGPTDGQSFELEFSRDQWHEFLSLLVRFEMGSGGLGDATH